MVAPGFDVGRIEPKIGPLALDGSVQEGADPLVDLGAEPGHLAFADTRAAHGLHQCVHVSRRDPLHVGLLDHGRKRLLGRSARLQKGREVAPLAQPGNAQLDRARPRLPVPVAVAIAVRQAIGAPLAMGRTGRGAHLQFHQPLGGEADHLTQQSGIRAFRQ